jgi:hypothetical protein
MKYWLWLTHVVTTVFETELMGIKGVSKVSRTPFVPVFYRSSSKAYRSEGFVSRG